MSKIDNHISVEQGDNGGPVTVKGPTTKISKKTGPITISISIVVVLIIGWAIVYFLSANSPEKLIIGRWQMSGATNYIEFTESGRLTNSAGSNGAVFTYHMQGDNRLQIDVQVLWGHGTIMADVDVTKNTLTLSNFSDPDDVWGFDENTELKLTRMK